MLLIKSFLTILLTLSFSTAIAADACSALFVTWPSVYSFTNKYRQSHILPLQSEMPKVESGYSLKGRLGQSTAKVYLASDLTTKKLVVVKLNSTLWMFWRELMVTEYLLDNGETVPRILKATIKSDGTTLIVREYFKGLTGEELNKERELANLTLPSELSDIAWKLLDPERDRLKNLFLKGDGVRVPFETWYLANSFRLAEKYRATWNTILDMSLRDPELLRRIDETVFAQDFGRANFLFDIQRYRWIAFDP